MKGVHVTTLGSPWKAPRASPLDSASWILCVCEICEKGNFYLRLVLLYLSVSSSLPLSFLSRNLTIDQKKTGLQVFPLGEELLPLLLSSWFIQEHACSSLGSDTNHPWLGDRFSQPWQVPSWKALSGRPSDIYVKSPKSRDYTENTCLFRPGGNFVSLGQLVSSVEYFRIAQPWSSWIWVIPLAATESVEFPARVYQRPSAKTET